MPGHGGRMTLGGGPREERETTGKKSPSTSRPRPLEAALALGPLLVLGAAYLLFPAL